MNENQEPSPNPNGPEPGKGNPIEIDPGDLSTKPEVDIGTPLTPTPGHDPIPEKEPNPERMDPEPPETYPQ